MAQGGRTGPRRQVGSFFSGSPMPSDYAPQPCMLWFWIRKEKFNLGHNYTFWKITFHNNTRIPFYFLSSKISPILAPGVSPGPQQLPQQQHSPGLAAASPVFLCFSLWFPVSQQESILSKEEIEAFRQVLPPPTPPKHSSCQNDIRQFPIQLATPVCMRSLFSKGQSGGTKAKPKGRDQVRT